MLCLFVRLHNKSAVELMEPVSYITRVCICVFVYLCICIFVYLYICVFVCLCIIIFVCEAAQ